MKKAVLLDYSERFDCYLNELGPLVVYYEDEDGRVHTSKEGLYVYDPGQESLLEIKAGLQSQLRKLYGQGVRITPRLYKKLDEIAADMKAEQEEIEWEYQRRENIDWCNARNKESAQGEEMDIRRLGW